MDKTFDFSGWATKHNIKCSDGRIINKDAFKHQDGQKVPLVWNHRHSEPENVLGHAYLEYRDEGVYAYGKFNNNANGLEAKELVQNGDIDQLSIYANGLREQSSSDGRHVIHGAIREVSLVLAGANPQAYIENVIKHGEVLEDDAYIFMPEYISVNHSAMDDSSENNDETLTHAEEKEEPKMAEEKKSGKTLKEVFNTLTEEQKTAVYAIVGAIQEDKDEEDEEDGGNDMKPNTFEHNAFDRDDVVENGVLSHSDQEKIITMAKSSNVGSLQNAIRIFAEERGATLAHGIDEIETLFPEYKDVYPGAPELIERDQTWVMQVMRKTHKSPISRIRTRQADARGNDLRAHGYQKKGNFKTLSGNIKLMNRTTDPQTVYRKDALHRDDIIDITEFDVVEYQYGVMKRNLYEDLALATMVGDGRDDGDADKIHEEHIRPIWKDDELYTIHYDVDIEAARTEIQGTNTSANFSENYIFAEALIRAALYSREQYKGSGNLEFYCTPHLLNVMLLARDLNGRRIYDSKADLEKALNVSAIHTAEQFEGLMRTNDKGERKKLLGLFVNLADYQHGSTKGGEITRFEQFDIDFNQQKYLIETRLSGALTKIKSAIALEEPVTD